MRALVTGGGYAEYCAAPASLCLPVPEGLSSGWAGLSYINIVWQQRMVSGMGRALGGSFVVVFIMMSLLFRSIRWGLLSMLPLTATIVGIYGALGFLGRDYDMPTAVLSSLALGLSVDFSIHFIERSREYHKTAKNFEETMMLTFGGTVVASPSTETNTGRAFLEKDPNTPGSLGIAISEAIEDAATTEGTNYALGSVLNHVILHP